MADASSTTDTSTADGTTSEKRKKGGLLTFIKKNKTLSAVVGGIGGYLLYKMSKEKSGGSTEAQPEGEVNAVAGEGGAIAGTAEAAAFELGRAERLAESSRSEVEEIEAEREEERILTKERKRKHEEEEEEEGKEPNPTSPTGPNGSGLEPVSPAAPSISVHGKTFPGATGSHIAKTGQTPGGKKYVEYAIKFPGKVEHWQYFTEAGNWRQVAGSDTGGGANKPGPGNNPKPIHNSPIGGPATHPKRKHKPIGIGQGHPVGGGGSVPIAAAPPSNPSHPAAVNTGNRCVNGGVGGHTAPAGYHLFCQDGWIWRAPNA